MAADITRLPLRLEARSRSWLPCYSPNDGSLLAEVEQLHESDIPFLLENLRQGQNYLNNLPIEKRAHWLKAISQKIMLEAESLSFLIATEGGKPLKDAQLEVVRASHTFDLCAQECLRLSEETQEILIGARGERKLARHFREPIGPVLAFSAFNHPLNLLAHQVGSALAAGCAIVFKPSPATPLCAQWLIQALQEISVPEQCAQLVHCDNDLARKLVSLSEFQFFSFIGSAQVGWELRRHLAAGTRLALEHGGQAPAIVCQDAEIGPTVKALIRGAFYHAGQVCISTQKIYVHHAIQQDFCTHFVAQAKELLIGDARSIETDVGPLIRKAEKERILQWIEEAQSLGAKLLLGPRDDLAPNYLNPCVLAQVPHQCQLWTREVFGPVVCLETFSTEEVIVAELLTNRFPFQAAVFTRDQDLAMRLARRLNCMSVVINDHTAWRVDAMPFGGHQEAGLGMGGVHYAIAELTRLKQVILALES